MTDRVRAPDRAQLVAQSIMVMATFSLIQGLPSYFFTIGLPALMRDHGASLSLIGLTYVVWLPHAFKWLWAPLFDRPTLPPFGVRHQWLRALPLVLACCFALVALFPPGPNMVPLVVLSLVCALVVTTLQMVTAAWLIGAVSAATRATANSVGVAAMVLGGMTGGGLIIYLGEALSWPLAIFSVCILIVLLSLPAWLGKTMTSTPQPMPVHTKGNALSRAVADMVRAWGRVVRRPGFPVMAVVVICLAGSGGADVLMAPLMVDRGFSAVETGWILGTAATGAIIPISLGVGWLLRTYGTFSVLAALLVGKAAVLLLLAASGTFSPETVAVLAALDFCFAGALTVTAWQLYMNFAAGPQSTTDFALVSSLDALIRFGGGIAAGQVGEALSYPAIFTVTAGVAILGAVSVMFLRNPLRVAEQS